MLSLTEINECAEGIAGCNQLCTNLNGSYTCSCNHGFHLANDGHQCEGISVL